jgi:hypothetical protein
MELWLLEGDADAPGWDQLERDARAKKIDVLLFDRDRWALARAEQPPDTYPGLVPRAPADGLYLDHHGRPCYVAGRREVASGRSVVRALGAVAEALLAKLGDPDVVLERLGRVF